MIRAGRADGGIASKKCFRAFKSAGRVRIFGAEPPEGIQCLLDAAFPVHLAER